MKSSEKLELINSKIKLLNDSVLKTKTWKLNYVNRGANNYCITIMKGKEELFNGKFNTYDCVLSALSLIENMFKQALNERK